MALPVPTRRLAPLLTLVALATAASATTAGASAVWAGADLRTTGYGVRAGVALLPIPFVGSLGVEAGAERGYNTDTTAFSAALTLRDLNLPLTPVDAFATVGAEFTDATRFYAEAGLRGPLFGPAGWRAHVRARQDGAFSGGVGIELRF
ncbi:hypothetical protein [Deinococcus altitudinis]|uniref:hypothetical protein n=1 Tax=Deinococcus altitudinis TaxID=468914 RepID=UPI003892CA75